METSHHMRSKLIHTKLHSQRIVTFSEGKFALQKEPECSGIMGCLCLWLFYASQSYWIGLLPTMLCCTNATLVLKQRRRRRGKRMVRTEEWERIAWGGKIFEENYSNKKPRDSQQTHPFHTKDLRFTRMWNMNKSERK